MGYVDLLHNCYREELWGSCFFETVRDLRPLAARKKAFLNVFATMEYSMQELLARLLKRHGQLWDEQAYAAQAQAIGQGTASAVGTLPWQAFHVGLEQAVRAYLAKYGVPRDRAPRQDQEMLSLFVQQEAAFLQVARAERVHESEASLAPV